jgi:hypothetical protein
MEYLSLDAVRAVHLELSSHCNAACPQCDRNIFGGALNPRLRPAHWSLADVKRVFTSEFCAQLNALTLSGVHGDPLLAPQAREILTYFRESAIANGEAQTNGSFHGEWWWSDLGSRLRDSAFKVVFALDGLEDTHALYRRGTDWRKATANMRALIAAGGKAQWNFHIFKHNQHQVEAARQLAYEWGCVAFQVRMTHRFHAAGVRDQAAPCPVLNAPAHSQPPRRPLPEEIAERLRGRDLAKTDFAEVLSDLGFAYQIEETTLAEHKNPATQVGLAAIQEGFESYDSYLEKTPISCREQEKGGIYMDADMRVWPCCYVGGDTKAWRYSHRFRDDFARKVQNKFDPTFNDLKQHSLGEILRHEWFREELGASWKNSLSDPRHPRLKRCGRTCGALYRPNSFENKPLPFAGPTSQLQKPADSPNDKL